MSKKILLLFPPFERNSAEGYIGSVSKTEIPPIGLLYLASPLKIASHRVDFIDLHVKSFEEKDFYNKLAHYEFVLITCYTQSILIIIDIIDKIKRLCPSTSILCGGPYCVETLSYIPGSDLTATGEAENYIVTIIDRMSNKEDMSDIPGIIYPEEGALVRTEGSMISDNLDSIDMPSLDLVDWKDYGYFGPIKFVKMVPILTSRGCPFQCRFCTFKIRKYRSRSVDNVIEELKQRSLDGFKYIMFTDSNFSGNKKRALEIASEIKKSELKLKIVFQGRPDITDVSFYRKLKKSGVIAISFGIESANQDVLDFYNKRTKLDIVDQSISAANRAGIITVGNFMLGSPVETRNHFESNRQFIKRVPLDLVRMNVLAYIYGSQLWQDMYNKNILAKGDLFILADENTSNFIYEELYREQEDFVKLFYSDKKRILRIFKKLIKLRLFKILLKGPKMLRNKSQLSTADKSHITKQGNVSIRPELIIDS